VNFVGTVEDITERKDRDEREHLLMREVNHRAKNMLSVVDAIAQRVAASDPQNFAQRFSERIQALSANQDLLIRNEWKGVGVEDLVRAQLAHFADLIGSRIGIQGPKLLKGLPPKPSVSPSMNSPPMLGNMGRYRRIVVALISAGGPTSTPSP
jgi:HWE histidine kinase